MSCSKSMSQILYALKENSSIGLASKLPCSFYLLSTTVLMFLPFAHKIDRHLLPTITSKCLSLYLDVEDSGNAPVLPLDGEPALT